MYVLDKTITEREKHHDTHDTLLEDMDNSNIILCYMIWIIPLSHSLKVDLDDEQTGFLLTLTNPFAKVLKIVGVGDFVERMLLYKMWYRTKL